MNVTYLCCQVEVITGAAAFTGPKEVQVGDIKYTAEHILIAVGGEPSIPGIRD